MRDEGPAMMDRRAFMGTAAAFALAQANNRSSLISHLSSVSHPSSRISRIGLQLYTVRNLMKTDFEGTLAKVAQIGYREVEFAGYFDHAPADVRAVLDRHALVSPASHVSFEKITQGWDAVLDACHTIGHQWAVVPSVPAERSKTADDWRRIAALFNEAGEACKRAGVRFAYHNHDMEFAPVDGRVPFDLLLDGTDCALVDFEMDLFWITFGGGDPLAYFAKYPGRFPMVHVKDMVPKTRPDIPPDSVQRSVGKGRIDWKQIFARSQQAGIKHYFVEHDNPADALASIGESFGYMKQLDF